MSMSRRTARLVAGCVLAAALCSAATAFAQIPQIPREFYEGRRRDQQDHLTFCLWPHDGTRALDMAVGTAIAGALLLKPAFYNVVPRAGMDDQDFQETLFIALKDHCDASLGISLAWQPLPDWLTISRSYYDAPFLVAASGRIAALSDLPAGRSIGSVAFTTADEQLLAHIDAMRASTRWRRIPYTTAKAALTDLADGRIDAALMFGPDLFALTEGVPESRGVSIVSGAPVRLSPMAIGMALLARDSFTRAAIDQAIAALRGDGTIARLVKQVHLPAEMPESAR